MIKAVMRPDSGRPMVILGLSQDNLDRLPQDMPIVVALEDLGLPPMDVVILGGKTEESILADMHRAGLIGLSTKHYGTTTPHDG